MESPNKGTLDQESVKSAIEDNCMLLCSTAEAAFVRSSPDLPSKQFPVSLQHAA